MRSPVTTSIAHKKPNQEIMKKNNTKNSGFPVASVHAFYIFLNKFQYEYLKKMKGNMPDDEFRALSREIRVGEPGKAGTEKWNSMTMSEKAPFLAEGAAFEKHVERMKAKSWKKKNHQKGSGEKRKGEKSTSKVHNEEEVTRRMRMISIQVTAV